MNDTTIVHEIQVQNPEVTAIKNLAMTKIEALKKVREDRKNAREMLQSALEANADYTAAKTAWTEAQRKHKEAKARAMENPEVYKANDKIKDLTKQYNELKTDVGDYLVTYADKTGQLSFITPDGNEVLIARSAKATIVPPAFHKK